MNLMDLVIGVTVDGGEAERGIDKVKNTTQKAFGVIGKVVAGAVGAAGGGLVMLSKQAISAYGDYEQLVGGVETLFGTGGKSIGEYAKTVGKSVNDARANYKKLQVAQDTVMNNARNAFKTAGMSANKYMENVTSFSASLISSLGGDTQKAAEVADMAMVDMSDNANKMGSSLESITNAYQGFAKGNFMMLDNLKLGYGGTKTEMERLLQDAEAIKKANGEMADYSIESFADMVEAIHVVQDEMGITGTTMDEAEKTISGSIGMMKAAWENFMTSMADPNGDFDTALDDLIESVVKVAENIGPKLIEAIPNIVDGLMELVDGLIPYVGPMLDELLPEVVDGAINLVTKLGEQMPTILDSAYQTIYDAVTELLQKIWDALPPDIQTALENLMTSFTNLGDSLEPVTDIFQGAIDKIGEFITSVTDGKSPTDLLKDGIDGLANVINNLATFSNDAITKLKEMKTWFDSNKDAVLGLATVVGVLTFAYGAYTAAQAIAAAGGLAKIAVDTAEIAMIGAYCIATDLATAATTAFGAVMTFLTSPITLVIAVIAACVAAGVLLYKNWDTVKAKVTELASAVKSKFDDIKNGITNAINSAKDGVHNAIEAIKGFFSGLVLKLPDIKLPHFKLSGSFSLNPPSVPTIGIDWYAKAMNNPMLLNSASIFGMANDGTLLGGGERGAEVVSGADTLMTMIATAVENSNNKVLNNILNELQTLNAELYGTIASATENVELSVNGREFARVVHKYA